MSRVIYITDDHYEDYQVYRFEFHELSKLGINNEVWNISTLKNDGKEAKIKTEAHLKEEIAVNSFQDIESLLNKLYSHDLVIIGMPIDDYVLKVLYLIELKSVHYAYLMDTHNIPNHLTSPFINTLKLHVKKIVNYLSKSKKYNKYPIPDYVLFASAKHGLDIHKQYLEYLRVLNSKIYILHSYDFNQMKYISGVRAISYPYFVFIDQYMPFHPDNRKYENSFEPAQYYNSIAIQLERLCELTKTQCIILLHPKSKGEELQYIKEKMTCVHGDTAGYIKNSDFIVGQFSTALSYGVIFNKPIIFIKSLGGPKYVNSYSNNFAKYLKKRAVFIKNNENIR